MNFVFGKTSEGMATLGILHFTKILVRSELYLYVYVTCMFSICKI